MLTQLACLVAALAPELPASGHFSSQSLSRRAAIGAATAAVSAPAFALESKRPPDIKALVAELDASTPKAERNSIGDKAEFFPKISFEGAQGQGKKIVFTVNHENLSPPSFSAIEFMWIKDENTGAILTAKRFRASDPSLIITAFGSPGQKLTAASKDDKFGIWQGTFVVP